VPPGRPGLAAVMAIVFAPWTAAAPVHLTAGIDGSMLALGILGTGIAYVWNTGIIARWGVTAASTVTYLIPIVGVVVLREPLIWNEPVGAVLVIGGILAVQDRVVPMASFIQRRAGGRRVSAVTASPRAGTAAAASRGDTECGQEPLA
jgi:drug/metabolite transporter (DMT)-like permease